MDFEFADSGYSIGGAGRSRYAVSGGGTLMNHVGDHPMILKQRLRWGDSGRFYWVTSLLAGRGGSG